MDNLERSILGEILLLDDFEKQVDQLLRIGLNDFENDNAKNYLKVFNEVLIKKRIKIDQLSLYESVKELKFFDAGEFAHITEGLIGSDIDYHLKLLKERNYKKDISKVIIESKDKLDKSSNADDVENVKDELITILSGKDFLSGASFFIEPKNYISKIDDNLSRDKTLEGPSWGLSELDVYTNGIERPRLIVVGGLKKSGKTKFIINTRYRLHQQGLYCPFLSLEMPGYEITKQTISRFTGIPEPFFRAKSFMSSEQNQIYHEVKKKINWELMPTEVANGVDVYQVVSRIRRYSRLYPGSIIFIDFLQRIKHDRNKQSFELENISNMIADGTREFDVTVVLLSQLSNQAEKEGVSIGALKGSGGIGESADTVILLDNIYRRTKDESKKGIIELHLEQRYGDSGIIKLESDLSCCKFIDCEVNNTFQKVGTQHNSIKDRFYKFEKEDDPF